MKGLVSQDAGPFLLLRWLVRRSVRGYRPFTAKDRGGRGARVRLPYELLAMRIVERRVERHSRRVAAVAVVPALLSARVPHPPANKSAKSVRLRPPTQEPTPLCAFSQR